MWCVGDKSTGCVVQGQEEEQELKGVCVSVCLYVHVFVCAHKVCFVSF